MAIHDEGGGGRETPRELWQVERDRTLTARIGRFRLTIKSRDQLDGLVLFLIQSSERQTLLASGCETDARRAMAFAERMAKRFSGS